MSKILSSGDSLVTASIWQNLLMQHFSRGQLPSILGRGFGNLGHLESAISSYGWLLEIELEADRLARRGLQHPTTCPHCDQDEENINHLLLSCVFAREFWFSLLQRVGLQHLCPQMEDVCFDDWWDRISSGAVDLIQKVLIPLLF
jgi:hypothetical protein